MDSTPHDPTAEPFARIVAALADGGTLTADNLDFIDAALFPPTPAALTRFLGDADNSERDSLLDLIFFPGPAFQLELEPLLESAPLGADDDERLRQRLLATPIEASIRMPDGGSLGAIRLPGFIKRHYLERLNPGWRPSPAVAAAIAQGVAVEHRPLVRVRLRNAGIDPDSDQQRFLIRFFERMPDDDREYLAALDLMLSLLTPWEAGSDHFERLAAHKRTLFRTLQQALRFESLLRRSNMETLMLQGVRAPHAAPDALRQEMRLIDRICASLFGRTEHLVMAVDAPLREIGDADDPEAAVRMLLDNT